MSDDLASTPSAEDVAVGTANDPNLHKDPTMGASELTLRTSDGIELQAE